MGVIIVLTGVPMYYAIQMGGSYGPFQNYFAKINHSLACLLNVCVVRND